MMSITIQKISCTQGPEEDNLWITEFLTIMSFRVRQNLYRKCACAHPLSKSFPTTTIRSEGEATKNVKN